MSDPRFGYRPALDGVRALAVGAVLVFHGLPALLPGGFLGVDAFFVLSGFLITALLLAERDRTGRIRLGAFWLRRARRLLPALLLVIAAVVGTARWFVPAGDLASLRADALATLGYVANWRMIYRGDGYFDTTAANSLLQHAWSLGIEEQFYLLWPLAVLALRSRAAVGLVAAAGAVASTVAAAVLFDPAAPDRAYFGTDTRAAALLIGCATAAALPVLAKARAAVTGGAAAVAVALVGAGWALADGTDGRLYRGGLAVLGLAVAAVLAHVVLRGDGLLARALAVAPLVALGRVSYGVYLWHWPLYGVLTGARTGLSGPALLAARVAATVAVATVSYVLVERPVLRTWRPRRRIGVPVTALATGAVVALALALPARPPAIPAGPSVAAAGSAAPAAPGPPPSTGPAPPAPGAPPSTGPAPPASGAPPATGPAPLARPGRVPGGPRVLMLGDSVAWSLGEYLPPDPRLWFINGAIGGCGIARLPDIRYVGRPHTNYPGCATWDARWRDTVRRTDPDLVVILLDRWELMDRRLNGRYQHVGDPEFDAYLVGELDLAWSIGTERGARLAVLTAPYTRRAERPDGGLWEEDTPQRVDAWNRLLVRTAAAHPARPAVLDLAPVVCPDGRYTSTVNGVRVRSDGLHFTPEGVRSVVAPWLQPRVASLAGAG